MVCLHCNFVRRGEKIHICPYCGRSMVSETAANKVFPVPEKKIGCFGTPPAMCIPPGLFKFFGFAGSKGS